MGSKTRHRQSRQIIFLLFHEGARICAEGQLINRGVDLALGKIGER